MENSFFKIVCKTKVFIVMAEDGKEAIEVAHCYGKNIGEPECLGSVGEIPRVIDSYTDKVRTCEWKQFEEDIYTATCCDSYHFVDQTIKFCPYCGLKIKLM